MVLTSKGLVGPWVLEPILVELLTPEAEAAVVWGKAKGYRPSEVAVTTVKGHEYAFFDLIKNTVPTIERITPETTIMLEAAAQFGLVYDGWGCLIVK